MNKKIIYKPDIIIVGPKMKKFMVEHPEMFPKAKREDYECSWQRYFKSKLRPKTPQEALAKAMEDALLGDGR